jgi:hypothetical protein
MFFKTILVLILFQTIDCKSLLMRSAAEIGFQVLTKIAKRNLTTSSIGHEICLNTLDFDGFVFGNFSCPLPLFDSNEIYCCGEPSKQYCCMEKETSDIFLKFIWYIIFGICLFCILILILNLFCYFFCKIYFYFKYFKFVQVSSQ